MSLRRLLLRVGPVVVLAGLVLFLGSPELPDRWNPWAPLRLDDPPNLLTGYKLRRLRDDPAACRAVLNASDFAYRPVPDRVTGEGCGFRNAVRVSRSEITYAGGFVATCPLVVALALFERHALQPAAQETLGARVTAIDHYGTYACRNVNGRDTGRRSQHATANAIDIAGFRLADGRKVRVAADWDRNGPPSEFLRDVHAGACGIFGAVLGPNYNRAHRDHFHLDLGGFLLCR